MKSVGEVMAIGRNFQESMQKALRGLETGLDGFNRMVELEGASRDQIVAALSRATPERLLVIGQAFREGLSVEDVHAVTKYEPWFLRQIEAIIAEEKRINTEGLPIDAVGLRRLKSMGFSDKRLATLAVRSVGVAGGMAETQARRSGLIHDVLNAMAGATSEEEVRALRHKLGVRPVFKRIDSCAAEFEAVTPYMYSTYESGLFGEPENEAAPTDRKKIVILGGGPNRIGQGIEFDYCCCHACFALGDTDPANGEAGAGFETIMINCNPETVSTDYDTSDRLYFEPLTAEDVLEVLEAEKANGTLVGVIVQFGGQTPLKLAQALEDAGIPILGTSPDAIDLAEDRERFNHLVEKLGLRQPLGGMARSRDEAVAVATRIGYPVLIRPSYVLGGRAMEIVDSQAQLDDYIATAVQVSGDSPVLIDQYLRDAIECDVDALADGDDVVVAGVMQHIEEAGIHSGDSACALPPITLGASEIERIRTSTLAIAKGVGVLGLLNVQYALAGDVLYVLEANPRASRTVPFVSKATAVPIAKAAARVMVGQTIAELREQGILPAHGDGGTMPAGSAVSVKEAVLPFGRFHGVDTVLGPEMRSTGEVMGIDDTFGIAFAKSQDAAFGALPMSGTAFVSLANRDKRSAIFPIKILHDLGFTILATQGTAEVLGRNGVPAQILRKQSEGTGPNGEKTTVDAIMAGDVQLIINTPYGVGPRLDGYEIRTAAVTRGVPCITTVQGLAAAVQGIESLQKNEAGVRSLQEHGADLAERRAKESA
jgi:carbamoyl-phosphate synthase large subunit